MPDSPAIDLLGWTLLHFVWQGVFLAAVVAGALHLLRNHTPRVRYAVSCVALIGLLALPVGTGVFLSEQGAAAESSVATVRPDAPELAVLGQRPPTASIASATLSWREQAAAWLQPVLPYLVLGWGVGVVVFAIRLAGGAWRVRRLRRSSRPAPPEWQERVRALAHRMNLRRAVALRRSDRVDSPAVAGWWQPVVLVPAGLLAGLPPAQVEALLLHELAHVRRHDVLVGRLQAMVETLLFFHPATWWISKQVRRTREACCDDLVVRAGTDRTVYARALTAMAERAVAGPTAAWAPAATGGSLVARIRRLLSPTDGASTHTQRLSMAAAVLLLVGVPLGLAACASQQSATDPQQETVTTEVETEESTDVEAPSPEERPAEAKRRAVVVMQDDSTTRTLRIESDGPVNVDRLGEDVYVFRYDGRADTVDLPHLENLVPPFPPDSLGRALRMRIDVDSLDRVIRARINPDSLERLINARINVDSLDRDLHMRLDPDSLERRALRMRLRADSMRLHPPHPDRLERELRIRIRPDSLARWHREHADSLRRHLDTLRERMEREMPERLREQARRLREQAERMEERAREMEAPTPPDDTSDRSDASGPDLDGEVVSDSRAEPVREWDLRGIASASPRGRRPSPPQIRSASHRRSSVSLLRVNGVGGVSQPSPGTASTAPVARRTTVRL